MPSLDDSKQEKYTRLLSESRRLIDMLPSLHKKKRVALMAKISRLELEASDLLPPKPGMRSLKQAYAEVAQGKLR